MVTFVIRIMLASFVFAIILNLSSCEDIGRAQLSQREDEDRRKDFDGMAAGPLNRNKRTVNPFDWDGIKIDPIDRKRFKIYPPDSERLKKNPLDWNRFAIDPLDWDRFTIDPLDWDKFTVYPPDWDRFTIDPLDWDKFTVYPPDWDRFTVYPPDWDRYSVYPPDWDRITIHPHDLDVTTQNPFVLEEKSTTEKMKNSTLLPLVKNKNFFHLKETHASAIIFTVLVPVVIIIIVMVIVLYILYVCKYERHNSTHNTIHAPPRPEYPLTQTTMEQYRLPSATGWTPTYNETPNDVLDKPPSYSEIEIPDFNGGPISFPAVQVEILVPESPPPKYDTEMMKY